MAVEPVPWVGHHELAVPVRAGGGMSVKGGFWLLGADVKS